MSTQPTLPALTDANAPAVAPLSLFSEYELDEVIREDENRGIYTGERCPVHLRNAIIQLHGDVYSIEEIKRTLSCDPRTIKAVLAAFPEEAEQARKRTINQARRLRRNMMDRMESNPSLLPPSSYPMMLKTLTDVEQLLDGKPTGRIEHTKGGNLFDDWEEFVEKKLTDVIEVESETGFGAEKKGVNKNEAALGKGDVRSDGQAPSPQGNASDSTVLTPALTVPQADSRRPDEPRGGDRPNAESSDASIGNESQKILPNTPTDS